MTYQIIYSSDAAMPMQTEDLENILEQARRNNEGPCITDALVYAEGAFLQLLEAERAQVLDLMHWAGIGVASGAAEENSSPSVEEQNRTAQFALDILSLLVAHKKSPDNGE